MTLSTKSRRSNRLPSWLRRRIPRLSECAHIESVIGKHHLHTICREALCPNRVECYSKKKVTFIILGNVCTRGCRFCSVKKGTPLPPDGEEPENIARAARELGLKHVVVTSVTRDDLKDGGGSHYASVIEALKGVLDQSPTVEVLVPDFGGDTQALETVLDAGPDILSHNMETVKRLYGELRCGADYERSLLLLSEAKKINREVMTKSAFILGLGETLEEIMEAFQDLRRVDCDFLAIGQYLRPGMDQVPVRKFVSPESFSLLENEAQRMGFLEVTAGPLVRSSYQENRLGVHRSRL
ncbi:MAG: lipoyl synthase, partial [Candidatus Krumholzibacteria bacterium]|nr:lipoyl synthase [Candidatus Krumholzibacteria bacterium]